MKLCLPQQVKGNGILPYLTALSRVEDSAGDITIDFANLRRITPLGLVSMMTHIRKWRNTKRTVRFENLETCPILRYLQRMDLLKCAEIALPESFERHGSKGKFVPVREIGYSVETMGNEMAECLAPGGEEFEHPLADLHELAHYVSTEIGNNVRQHSGGNGYACAQITRREGMIKIAIADNGRGILQSFQDAGLQGSESMSHTDAILKSFEARVSSKGTPTNEGVGLTLVIELAKLLQSWLLVVSGDAVVTLKKGGSLEMQNLPEGGSVSGTIIGLSIEQSNVRDFAALLESAKVRNGLLQETGQSVKFVP